ncbi:ABC transporter [Streptomyces regensis]|nr:ABC transporter [Streptomyces regensis]
MDGTWSLMSGAMRAADAPKGLRKGTVTRVASFARPHWRRLAVFLGLTVVAAVIAVSTPLLAGRVVDEIVGGGAVGVVVWLALAIAGLALADAAVGLAERWQSAHIGEGLIFDLRRAVFAHVQRMPIAFFTRTRTGALVSRLNNDVIGAQRTFTATLSGLVTNVIQLVLSVVVMVTLSWQVTALALVLLPIFVIPARRIARRMADLQRESAEQNASMTTQMTERFSAPGATLVKLFGRPAVEEGEFAERAGRVRDLGVRTAMLTRWFMTSLTLVYTPLTALANVRVDVMTALVSFERIFEVLDLDPMISEKADPTPLLSGGVSVEFDDVRFAYPAPESYSLASLEDVATLDHRGGEEVLHGVSFRADPGEMVALVGPSGAGKSTIAGLVPRLYDVDAGAVRLAGVDVRDLSFDSLKTTVGVVTQDGHLFHDTIRANLEYARPGATDEEITAALSRARLDALVRSLPDGLDTVVGERGYRLSGGERQRLTIARLLLARPQVVVLDEATAHLDSESEVAVSEALAEALDGRTSLVIAHRLSTIRAADRIVVVVDGRVVEQGTHEELLAAGGKYAQLYRTQFSENGDRREHAEHAEHGDESAAGARAEISAGRADAVAGGDGAVAGEPAGV